MATSILPIWKNKNKNDLLWLLAPLLRCEQRLGSATLIYSLMRLFNPSKQDISPSPNCNSLVNNIKNNKQTNDRSGKLIAKNLWFFTFFVLNCPKSPGRLMYNSTQNSHTLVSEFLNGIKKYNARHKNQNGNTLAKKLNLKIWICFKLRARAIVCVCTVQDVRRVSEVAPDQSPGSYTIPSSVSKRWVEKDKKKK